jgi:hypothetical protein
MATSARFRAELRSRFREAEAIGRISIEIVARHLHDAVRGAKTTGTQRIPNCCDVMRQEQHPGYDDVVSAQASDGPNFTIRYRLPR